MPHNLSNLWAIVVTAGLAGCLAVDLRRGLHRIVTARSAVLVSVFIWYLLEALRLPKDLAKYTQSEYDMGLFGVACALAVFLATYHAGKIPLFAPLARRLPMLDDPRILWLLVVGGMSIGIGSLFVYSGFDVWSLFDGLIGMRRRWTGIGRGRYGSWSTIVYELQMFLYATVPLAVALAFKKRANGTHRWVAGVFVVWMFLRTFSSGGRTALLPIVLSVTAAIFWNSSARTRRWLTLAGAPLALIVGYYWSAVIVEGRNEGRFDTSVAGNVDYVGFEMFREFLFVMRKAEKDLPLQWGYTYFTQLVNPIPRAIWPGKPVADAGLIMARAYGAVDRFGEPIMTISPGFLGEAYLNFGFLGLLVVPAAAGAVARGWDELLPVASRSLPVFLVYAAGVATVFASGRSFNFSTFYGLLALFALMWSLEGLGLWKRVVQPSRSAPRPAAPLRIHRV